MTYASPQKSSQEVWYLDSGCSNHLTGARHYFKELDKTQKSQVRLEDDKLVKIEGKGTVSIYVGDKERLIKNVNYAPGLAHNLISVGQLVENGYTIIFRK